MEDKSNAFQDYGSLRSHNENMWKIARELGILLRTRQRETTFERRQTFLRRQNIGGKLTRQTFHCKLLAAINWRQRQSFFGGKLFLAAKWTGPFNYTLKRLVLPLGNVMY